MTRLAVPVTWLGIADYAPRRTGRTSMWETWRGNRELLTIPSISALMVALCVPNSLVAGCEALFVPYAGGAAAPLFVAGALGMLAGDVAMGRVLGPEGRRRSLGAESAARVTCQGLAAVLAGALAELTPPGAAIALLAVGSLLVSLALTPSLRRAAGNAAALQTRAPLMAAAS
jgi:hypothetical protein